MLTLEQARAWYSRADGAHDFDHIQRVYRMARRLAEIEGADSEIVLTAALLHDVQGSSFSHDTRVDHQDGAADFAAQVLAAEGWPDGRITAVQHCIRAHRFRGNGEAPATLEAKVLFDADKLDAIGAIGVARSILFHANDPVPLCVEPSSLFLSTGQLAEGEIHTPYHEYLFKLSKLKDRMYTASGRRLADHRHQTMVNYFEALRAEIDGQC